MIEPLAYRELSEFLSRAKFHLKTPGAGGGYGEVISKGLSATVYKDVFTLCMTDSMVHIKTVSGWKEKTAAQIMMELNRQDYQVDEDTTRRLRVMEEAAL